MNMETCHAEIYRCCRVDLADRHPAAHAERNGGACVSVELGIWRQRVLTPLIRARASGSGGSFLPRAEVAVLRLDDGR